MVLSLFACLNSILCDGFTVNLILLYFKYGRFGKGFNIVDTLMSVIRLLNLM